MSLVDDIDINEALERAAIMQYDGGLDKEDAELKTALAYGFSSWSDLTRGNKND